MSDLDQLDPRLDQAFEALTRELARAHAPGAAAAVSTARRRRRTRVGGVALAALVVVGGGLTLPQLLAPEDGVAARGGEAPLDAAALERATEGWLSGWEEWAQYSPKGGGAYSMPGCLSPDVLEERLPQVAGGLSRFLGSELALATAVFTEYPDAATAERVQAGAFPACRGTTMTVDGAEVWHYAEAPTTSGTSVTDVWTVQIGSERLVLEVAGRAGVAPEAAVERMAEAAVAGLRSGESQETYSGDPYAVDPDARPQLPPVDGGALGRALDGWRSASRASASGIANTPCLAEQVDEGSVAGSSGGTPRGVTWSIGGFADDTAGEARIIAMLAELRACTDWAMSVEELPNGVFLATYDYGGPDGRGALWLAHNSDRAGVIAVDGADRPMPTGVAQGVADSLYASLRLPWD
jgi:hypothetical protein